MNNENVEVQELNTKNLGFPPGPEKAVASVILKFTPFAYITFK